jgi:two-component system OmpR family sensor kinase
MTGSLRGRLLLGLVALVVVGLFVSDLLTYTALQSFLLDRLDDQLRTGRSQAEALLADYGQPEQPGFRPRGPTAPPAFPEGTFAELRSPDGATVAQAVFGSAGPGGNARPSLPAHPATAGPDQPVLSTVPGTNGVARYRLLSMTVDNPSVPGDTLLLAIPLSDVDSTLQRLLLLELTIGLLVLLGTALFAWWVVRLGLRPLERMGATAAAIAAGDLSRRVEPATPHTEIGRLGLALNAMLSQIEASFAERTETAQRLRRFVADASHELRTPLTSIRGYAELLRRQPPPADEDASLARRRIEEEAIRMSGLVNDMLLLARLDQGRPLEKAPVDLVNIARDACDDARAVAPRRPISLAADGPVVVTGDEARLRQLVGNLVRNAVVHTPGGTPIEVSVARNGQGSVLTVVDHGPGLPAGESKRIFEPFHRVDPGRSRDRGGAGLGLSIVAAVVAAHGGHVQALPTPGGGATFEVLLPLAHQSEPAPNGADDGDARRRAETRLQQPTEL